MENIFLLLSFSCSIVLYIIFDHIKRSTLENNLWNYPNAFSRSTIFSLSVINYFYIILILFNFIIYFTSEYPNNKNFTDRLRLTFVSYYFFKGIVHIFNPKIRKHCGTLCGPLSFVATLMFMYLSEKGEEFLYFISLSEVSFPIVRPMGIDTFSRRIYYTTTEIKLAHFLEDLSIYLNSFVLLFFVITSEHSSMKIYFSLISFIIIYLNIKFSNFILFVMLLSS